MKRIITCLVCICIFSISTSSYALADGMQNIPYDSYTYWTGVSGKKLVNARAMYEVETVLTGTDLGISPLVELAYVFCDDVGTIYVLDQTRIIIINQDLKLEQVIDELRKPDGEILDFSGSKGIFVDADGLIYIADTNNFRIVTCDKNGNTKSIIELPDSPLIPDDFIYQPISVTVDSKGYIYVLSRGCFYGALLHNPNGEFEGFFGANKVNTSALDVLDTIWNMVFTNDAKRAGGTQKMPYQFTAMCIDSQDFLYTCTGIISRYSTQKGQIRRLGPSGENILRLKSGGENISSDTFDFADFGTSSDGQYLRIQDFTSISVDDNNYIYALEGVYGKIFLYDSECNLLNVFGGGVGEGIQDGTFQKPVSLTTYQDRIFVADFSRNNLTVFKRTEYGKLTMQANSLTLDGNYAESVSWWEQSIALDRNSQLAYQGLAKAAITNKDYKSALNYSRLGIDRETYSKAFGFFRNSWLKQNFGLVFGIVVFAILLLVVILVAKRKKQLILIKSQTARVMLSSTIHPFRSFNRIKYQNEGSVVLATGLLILFYIFNVLSDIYGGFIHSNWDSTSYNSLFTFALTFGVVIIWTISNWAVTVLVEGKSHLKEVYTVACYSLIPQIVNSIFFLIFSNILLKSESAILSIVSSAMMILTIVILCIGTMVINEFDFFKFLGTSVATLIAMAVIVCLMLMVILLLQQFFGFIITLFIEVWYR